MKSDMTGGKKKQKKLMIHASLRRVKPEACFWEAKSHGRQLIYATARFQHEMNNEGIG